MIKYITILIIIACIVASFFVGRCTYPVKEKHTRDTVWVLKYRDVIYHDTIRTTRTEWRKWIKYQLDTIVYIDTLFNTRPFKDFADTIINRDTINLTYLYPERIFSILLRQKPDSIMKVTETITKTVELKDEWWKRPAIFGSGVLVGIIGTIIYNSLK